MNLKLPTHTSAAASVIPVAKGAVKVVAPEETAVIEAGYAVEVYAPGIVP